VAITSFEVGSVFSIIDKASTPLAQLSTKMSEFGKIVAGVKKDLESIGTTSFAGFTTNLRVAIDGAITDTGRLEAKWLQLEGVIARTAAAARGMGGGGGLPHPRRNILGGGGAAAHISGGVPLPGGMHAHLNAGNAAMLGAGTVGYAAYLEAEVEDTLARTMFHLGRSDDASRETLRKDIQGALGMGFSIKEVGDSVQDIARLFKGTPGGGFENIPEVLRAAGTEARLKGTSLKESTTSLIELMHMTKEYEPEELAKLAPMFSFLSTATPMTLPQITKSMSYAVPLLQSAAEIDPAQTMLLGIAMQRAGVTSTKSGTWLRELAVRGMPGQSDLQSKKWFQTHQAELKELGLLDESGEHATWLTNGKPDLMKLLDIAGEHAQHIPLERRLVLERSLFGAQGGGAFAVLADPKVREQMRALQKEYPDFVDRYKTFGEMYRKDSPIQAGREAWGDLQVVLIDIGRIALPPVVAALKQFDDVLKTTNTILGPIIGMVKPGSPLDMAGKASVLGGYGAGEAIVSGAKWLWGQLFGGATSAGAAQGFVKQGTRDGAYEGTKQGVSEGLQSFQKMNFKGSGPNGGGLINASYVDGDGNVQTAAFHSGGGYTVESGGGGGGGGGSGSGRGRGGGGGRGRGGGGMRSGGPLLSNTGLAKLSSSKQQVAQIVANEWRDAGMSEAGIAGLLANIKEESSFNPTLRHPDQPRWGGEAHFAHGLYQEGGAEWLNYSKWLGQNHPGADWRDPKLQSEFAALNLKKNYPGVWSRMLHGSKEQAAAAYAAGYLKPAARYLSSRLHKFSHGVPGLHSYGVDSGAPHVDTGLPHVVGREHVEGALPHYSLYDVTKSLHDYHPEDSVTPAPHSSNEIHINHATHLDGRVIYKSTMKHMAGNNRRPTSSPRMPDNWTTRPIT
jgi:hypothetical protein